MVGLYTSDMIILTPMALPEPGLYQNVSTRDAAPGGYVDEIGYVPNCEGTACEYGTIEGRPGVHLPIGGRTVMIAGRKNIVVTHPCGANCGGSFATMFVANGATYTITIKGGRVADAEKVERALKPRSR